MGVFKIIDERYLRSWARSVRQPAETGLSLQSFYFVKNDFHTVPRAPYFQNLSFKPALHFA